MQRECFFSKCHDVFLSHVSMKCLRYHVWNGGGVRGIKSLLYLWSRWTCSDRYVLYEGFSFWKRRKPTRRPTTIFYAQTALPVGIQDLGFLLFERARLPFLLGFVFSRVNRHHPSSVKSSCSFPHSKNKIQSWLLQQYGRWWQQYDTTKASPWRILVIIQPDSIITWHQEAVAQNSKHHLWERATPAVFLNPLFTHIPPNPFQYTPHAAIPTVAASFPKTKNPHPSTN